MFDSRLPQDINFDFSVFAVKTRGVGSIFAVPLHINSISSYVLKTWWVHWSWVACKINYWHCTLRNPILKVCSLFHFLNVLLYKNMFLLLLWRAAFFCQHVGTLWLDACGMDWDLKPQKAMDGSHHHWDSLRRFNIHVAPSPCLSSAPLKCVQQSGKEIRPQFVAIGHFFL